jgi:hypothetical protein
VDLAKLADRAIYFQEVLQESPKLAQDVAEDDGSDYAEDVLAIGSKEIFSEALHKQCSKVLEL